LNKKYNLNKNQRQKGDKPATKASDLDLFENKMSKLITKKHKEHNRN